MEKIRIGEYKKNTTEMTSTSTFDYKLCQNLKTFLLNENADSVLVSGGNEALRRAYAEEMDNRYVRCHHQATLGDSGYLWCVLTDGIGDETVTNHRSGMVIIGGTRASASSRFALDETASKELTDRSEHKTPVLVYRCNQNKKNDDAMNQDDDESELVCDDIEDPDSVRQTIYDMCVTSVGVPRDEARRTFAVPNGNRLAICLIEFRRLKWLRYIVNQIAKVYGGTDVSLYVVHGKKNRRLFADIVKPYKNVQTVEYPYDNIDRDKYADICCDAQFYGLFKTQFVLKMEWDSYIRKRVPAEFFRYAYVGAPWQGYPNDYQGENIFKRLGNKLVGNGGFSLRKVSRMIEICEGSVARPRNVGEDVFLTNHLRDDEVPDPKKASEFSVEFVYNADPVGLHHVWTIHEIDKVKAWMNV